MEKSTDKLTVDNQPKPEQNTTHRVSEHKQATDGRHMSDSYYDRAALMKLKDACFKAKYLIKIYAASQEIHPDVLSAQLSQDISIQDMQWLIQQFELRDIESLPNIELRSRAALAGAWNRYIPEMNTIYLAEDFVRKTSKSKLLTTIFQEIISATRQTTQ